MVADNVQWEAIFAVPQIKELCGEAFSGNVCVSRCDTYSRPQTICYGDNCIMSILFQAGTDKVYGYRIASLVRGWEEDVVDLQV